MFLFIKEKNEYGESIYVIDEDKNVILETFVNFSKNWFDIPQRTDYWFSKLIYQTVKFDEKIYSNRTEYFLNDEQITDISVLQEILVSLNNFMNTKTPNVSRFIESDLSFMFSNQL